MLLASMLVMRIFATMLEVRLLPMPSISIPTPAAAPAPTPPRTLDIATFARVTGLPVPPPEPLVLEPTQRVDASSVAVHTSLKVKLIGTLVNIGASYFSMASIQDATTQKVATYMEGDSVLGAPILSIERDRVIINNKGRKEYIDATLGDGEAPPPQPVAQAPVASEQAAPGNLDLGRGIKQLGENRYQIPRGELDRTLSNLNDVALQARIIPAFKDGQATGFRLFSIRPDSVYSRIGMQNGDVIRRINGYEMNSPEKALEIYTKLKESTHIEIDVDRNGTNVTKSYNIQ